jgi:hypothetical protein
MKNMIMRCGATGEAYFMLKSPQIARRNFCAVSHRGTRRISSLARSAARDRSGVAMI